MKKDLNSKIAEAFIQFIIGFPEILKESAQNMEKKKGCRRRALDVIFHILGTNYIYKFCFIISMAGKVDKNSELIDKYIQHRILGKSIGSKRKKPISKATEKKLRIWLGKLSIWLNKDFEELTESDIDLFRTNLSKDKYTQRSGKPFSPNTKMDLEYKLFRPFMQWLGKGSIVEYANTYETDIETQALTREEVESMITATTLRNKVILTLLYDGGFRVGEFLAIRYNDILDDERKGSKGYYKVHCPKSKTKKRTIGLYMEFSCEVLDAWLKQNKEKLGTNKPLVDIQYENLRKCLFNLGKQTIKKKVYPHLLRHSSATYYCHKLNHYQLCKRFGWAMASKMPQIYIDREGVGEKEVGDVLMEEQAANYRKEVNQFKEENRLLTKRLDEQEKVISKLEAVLPILEKLGINKGHVEEAITIKKKLS